MEFINQSIFMILQAIIQNKLLVIVMLVLLVIAWVLWILSAKQLGQRGKTFVGASIIAMIGFFVLPSLFKSSILDLTYWLDWAFHITTVICLFIYSYLVLLPLFSALLTKKN